MITTDIYIGGDRRPASDGGTYDLYTARPSELVGHAAAATCDDIDDAVKGLRNFLLRGRKWVIR